MPGKVQKEVDPSYFQQEPAN